MLRSSRPAVVSSALVVLAALLPAALARAAALTEITGFGANPTNLRMHLYVPDSVASRPAVLVAVHFCTGSGPVFFQNTEFRTLADQLGFIVIYPSATRSGQCFDVSTPGALTHNGNSDPVGIVSMVRWVLQNRNGDPNRVYVTGASSGGMMTNVLLGDYPDVFKAGAAFMGVPFACFATTDGSLWNSTCANGNSMKTGQQWGDLVRGAFPGFTGARPRMQVWHGTDDTTLRFPNFGEEIKQWTNVLGVSQTPSFTDQPQSTWTRTRYGGTGTNVPVEAIRVQGAGHTLPAAGMARFAIDFFGLGATGGPDTMPPTTPGTPAASNVGQTTASLRWAASSDSGGSGLAAYDVFRHPASGTDMLLGTSPGTSINLTGLTAATSYTVYVVARDAAGNLSNPSGSTTFTSAAAGSEFSLVNVNSNKCLDVSGVSTADGARVQQWTCSGGANQRWRPEDAGGGYVRLRAVHSGKCLDVAGVSTADGALLQQWTCSAGQNQQFLLQDTGGGQLRITPRHSGKAVEVASCSTADGATVRQATWQDTSCQKFRKQ